MSTNRKTLDTFAVHSNLLITVDEVKTKRTCSVCGAERTMGQFILTMMIRKRIPTTKTGKSHGYDRKTICESCMADVIRDETSMDDEKKSYVLEWLNRMEVLPLPTPAMMQPGIKHISFKKESSMRNEKYYMNVVLSNGTTITTQRSQKDLLEIARKILNTVVPYEGVRT